MSNINFWPIAVLLLIIGAAVLAGLSGAFPSLLALAVVLALAAVAVAILALKSD